MSTNVTLNGVTYAIPAEGDSGWGTVLSNYFIAIASSTLQKTGGTFTLTADANFGASFGLKAAYLKSQATNPASAGIIRLGNAETIKWRNAANSSDLDLTVNSSNALQFNGISLLLANTDIAPTITGTRAAPSAIVAGTGVAFTGAFYNNIWFIQGSGGAVTISANPQIAAGTNTGQRLCLVGRDDTNTVTFTDGTGLYTGGQTLQLGANSIANFFWDGSAWVLESTNGLI